VTTTYPSASSNAAIFLPKNVLWTYLASQVIPDVVSARGQTRSVFFSSRVVGVVGVAGVVVVGPRPRPRPRPHRGVGVGVGVGIDHGDVGHGDAARGSRQGSPPQTWSVVLWAENSGRRSSGDMGYQGGCATRLRLGGRATTARWAARWRGGCEARRVRRQRCGGSAEETTRCGSHGARGLDGAHQCKRCRAGGGGGGGGWRRQRAATSHYPRQLFSCFLLLPLDRVKGELGRGAGWARSAARRVAAVGAHLQRPGRALPGSPSLPIDRDALGLTEHNPARVSQVARRRPPKPTSGRRRQLPPRVPGCAERGSGTLLGRGGRGGGGLTEPEIWGL
jgi:hypothetical protein